MSEIENLEREIAEKQDRLAELRAKQADPLLAEAEAFASLYYLSGFYGDIKLSTAKDLALAALRRGMELAALPLAPVVGMSEEEIEGLARVVAGDWGFSGTPYDVALSAIRETLRRAPKPWPSEGELREMAFDKNGDGFVSPLEMARRLKAWQTGESGNPAVRIQPAKPPVLATAEPEWIDWHGGECPVPAGTRVEVEYHNGSIGYREGTTMRHDDWRIPGHIRRYRILPGESA